MGEIRQLSNCNVYLNGQTLVGKIETIELPEIKAKMLDYKPLGLQSEIELPSGFEKMSCKIKWNSFYLKEFLQVGDFTRVNNLVIKGDVGVFGSPGKVASGNVTTVLNVLFKNFPLGKYAQNEMIDGLETESTVYSLTQIVDDVPLVVIDVFTNTYKVGAKDLLADFKINS